MGTFRVHKTKDYTVMSNNHLRNKEMTLKAKGLLSQMLSLPDDWNYTIEGLASINKEGVDCISDTLTELEKFGYVTRKRIRDEKGRLRGTDYDIYEEPIREKPILDNPVLEKPEQENPAQLNTKKSSKETSKTDLSITEPSNPIQSNPPAPAETRIGTDGMGAREIYREIVLDNIGYEYLIQDSHIDREQLDEIAELIVDTVCSARKTIRIAGDDYPAEAVKARFLKLDSSHVQYVMDCMRENTTYVRNIKKYLLAALYNAPGTISNYYSSLVQHDMYGDGKRGRG